MRIHKCHPNHDAVLYQDNLPTMLSTLEQAVKEEADLSFACIRDVYLDGADLSGARLSHAKLTTCHLQNANFSGADLRNAILRGSVLIGADFTNADLTGVDMDVCFLTGATFKNTKFGDLEIPVVPDLDQRMVKVVHDDKLNMANWHCDTTHCRAGWAIHLAGKAGYDLEEKFSSPALAGALIYWKSVGYIPDFWCSDEEACRDILSRVGEV